MNEDNQDIRWLQRFSNYKKAFLQLQEETEEANDREFSQLEKKGLIQSFEIVQELSWKVLKDLLEYLGYTDVKGSIDAFTMANTAGIINNGDILIKTVKSRNLVSHIYDNDKADNIFYDILEQYYQAFLELKQALEQEKTKRGL